MVVDETGGMHGVRDHLALQALVGSPRQEVFGKKLYPTIFEKAAIYARGIIMNHPFVDGNKRTGMTSAVVFLENNGYLLTAEEGTVAKFALEIVNKKLEIKPIASWLKRHSKKTKK